MGLDQILEVRNTAFWVWTILEILEVAKQQFEPFFGPSTREVRLVGWVGRAARSLVVGRSAQKKEGPAEKGRNPVASKGCSDSKNDQTTVA